MALPLLRVVWQGFFDPVTGEFSLEYFRQYIDPVLSRHSLAGHHNTMVMGLGTATGGTILGFIFAYTMVRCSVPFAHASFTS